VKTVGQQEVLEGRKKGRLDAVYKLRHRVWDVVRSRSGGVRGCREAPGYFFRGKGGIVLILREAEEGGRWGFGGEEVVKECFRNLGRVRGPW